MTKARKDGTKPPSRTELRAKAVAFREAADEFCRRFLASQAGDEFAAWLESRARRLERRAAALKPGRPGPDQLDRLIAWADRQAPRPPGRPATGHVRGANVYAQVEQWRDEREARGEPRPSVAEACRALLALYPRRGGLRPTVEALRGAYNRHLRRSKTSSK